MGVRPEDTTPLDALMSLHRAVGNRSVAHLIAEMHASEDVMAEADRSVPTVLNSPGEALPSAVQDDLSAAFGHSADAIRIHTDNAAADASAALGAQAFTGGADIAFGPGAYAPDLPSGRALLAHEFAHAVQQSGGGTAPPGAEHERAADEASSAVAAGQRAPAQPASASGVARAPDGVSETPFFDRLNRIYTKTLEIAPAPIRARIERANEVLRGASQATGVTPRQIDAALAKVEPALQAAETVIGSALPATPAPAAQDPAETVWLGAPPPGLAAKRNRDRAADGPPASSSDPQSDTSPDPPLWQLVDDPPPTEFERKLRSHQPFMHEVGFAAPDLDPRDATWLGHRPTDSDLRRTRFEGVDGLAGANIRVPGDEPSSTKTISDQDVMPIRDQKTRRLLGYRLRQGDTLTELDRDGHLISQRGLEQPVQVDEIQPDDILFAGLGLAMLLRAAASSAAARLAGQMLRRTTARAGRTATAAGARVLIGTAEALPVLEGRTGSELLLGADAVSVPIRDAAPGAARAASTAASHGAEAAADVAFDEAVARAETDAATSEVDAIPAEPQANPSRSPARRSGNRRIERRPEQHNDLITHDNDGRLILATGQLRLDQLGTGTATTADARAAAQAEQPLDAGHARGRALGGSGGADFTFPQLPGLNRGQFRVFEQRLRALVRSQGESDRIIYSVSLTYRPGTSIPDQIVYRVRINGATVRGLFFNDRNTMQFLVFPRP